MTWLRMIWREFIGLFVDDGALALQTVLLIAAIAVAVKMLGLAPLAGGVLLLIGCLIILVASVLRKTRP